MCIQNSFEIIPDNANKVALESTDHDCKADCEESDALESTDHNCKADCEESDPDCRKEESSFDFSTDSDNKKRKTRHLAPTANQIKPNQ